uniref:Uncharacterized protein n=1 Tax=Timema monikensis TaxID=170555 RepID=A0A7R9EAS3_9NEOP|nr:unnamed protein product [Timema monikensis]
MFEHLCGLVVRVPGYRSRFDPQHFQNFSVKQWVHNRVLNGEFRGPQVNDGRNGHGPVAEENEHLTDDSEENQNSNVVSTRNYFNRAPVNVSGAQGDLQADPVQRSIDTLCTQVEALTKTVALMEQKIAILENKLKNVLTFKNL